MNGVSYAQLRRSNSLPLMASKKTWTHTGNPPVDLGGVLTFRVRILGGGHLQHAHPEGVHVHGLVILLLVHLWSHELWGSWWTAQNSPLLIVEKNIDLSVIILKSTSSSYIWQYFILIYNFLWCANLSQGQHDLAGFSC